MQSKKMDESSYAKIVKEVNAVGEVIRTCQDEKQAVVDDFAKEKNRYSAGKISKKTLDSSAKKSNKELAELDKKIRSSIKKISDLSSRIRKFAVKQSPKAIRVKGISNSKKRKTIPNKKTKPKKKTAKQKKK